MPGARKWMGGLLLHAPAPVRSLRNVPILGDFIHRLSHGFVPKDEKLWVRVEAGPTQGLWLELNPRTGQNYLRGDAEIAVQQVLVERLRAGMVFYDLGANIGLFSLLAARLLGTDGKTFSFEPDPEVAARLRRNIERNQFGNITVVEAGVWSTSLQMKFVAADERSPDRGVGKFVPGETEGDGVPIRCVALDDFILNAPLPDAIKCDVEGAEMEVFRGAETILRTHRPWIVCEAHSDASAESLRNHLSAFGYKVESVDANHVLATP